MKTTLILSALLVSSLSVFACAEPPEEEDFASGSEALVNTSSCTVEKGGSLYKASAEVKPDALLVRIDGIADREKNNIEVRADYADGSKATLSMADSQPSDRWIRLPLFVGSGARYSVKVTFDFEWRDRTCTIDLQN